MTTIRLTLLAALLATSSAMAAPKDYAAALAPAGRAEKDVALDASRKPDEVLDFLGLKKGMRALDIMAGNGYYSQIMARAVGPAGSVLAQDPPSFVSDASRKTWADLRARQPNLRYMVVGMNDLAFAPASVDFALLHLVYHDFYWESAEYKFPRQNPDEHLAKLYAALKPGGVIGVIDHVGPAGDVRATVDKLHRIDPDVIKADFARAGFVLEAQSDVLRTPADDISVLVFDPKVRGKTDRVVYRFRKPAK